MFDYQRVRSRRIQSGLLSEGKVKQHLEFLDSQAWSNIFCLWFEGTLTNSEGRNRFKSFKHAWSFVAQVRRQVDHLGSQAKGSKTGLWTGESARNSAAVFCCAKSHHVNLSQSCPRSSRLLRNRCTMCNNIPHGISSQFYIYIYIICKYIYIHM